jgi:tetratricopeptide (TPR) repeat protein
MITWNSPMKTSIVARAWLWAPSQKRMSRSKPRLIAGLALASSIALFSPANTFAGTDENVLRAETIRLFQEGNFAKVVDIAGPALKLKPNDAVLRYFLANSLTKLGRRNDALAQYQQCLAGAQDSQLKTYCQQAIASLSAPAARPETSATAPEPDHTNVVDPAEGLNERKQQVLEEKEQQLQAIRKETDRKIEDIQRDVENQLADVPKTTLATVGYGFRARLVNVQNIAYEDVADNLRRQAQVKIDALNDDCKNRQFELSSYYDKKAAVYDRVAPNMQSQFKAGSTSLSQVTPKGTNGYVRNIVNYGADPDPLSPLRAKAGNLQPAQK